MSLVFGEWPADAEKRVVDSLTAGGSTDVKCVTVAIDVTRRFSVIQSRDRRFAVIDALSDRDVKAWIDPPSPEGRWHISVAGEKDVPRWKDLVAIAHALRPGVAFCVGVPPRSWWLNVHPNCLHVWELRDPGLIAQWRFEAQGHTPT